MAAPTVSTTALTAVTGTTASGGGAISSDGGKALTHFGVCWNTTGTPTVADAHTDEVRTGSGALQTAAAASSGSGASVSTSEPAATITYGAGTVTNPNNYANGAVVAGAGKGVTILTGRLDFGTSQEFRDLSIRTTADCAVKNASGTSHDVVFRRCSFRGGGDLGLSEWHACNVVTLLDSTYNVTFIDCDIDRNLGTRHRDCNVFMEPTIRSTGTAPTMHDILFKRCHLGTSNGTATGAPGFNVEIPTPNYQGGNMTASFSQINFEDCIFEKCADEQIDYGGAISTADNYTPTNGPCHVTGCTFYGDGASMANDNTGYPGNESSIVIEGGAGNITISGNTFYRGYGDAVSIQKIGTSTNGGCTVTNNVIDSRSATYDTGITHNAWEYIYIQSDNNEVSGNTVICSTTYRPCVTLSGPAAHNTVTGNTLTNTTVNGSTIVVDITSGCDYNTVTGNAMTGNSTPANNIRNNSGMAHNVLTPNP